MEHTVESTYSMEELWGARVTEPKTMQYCVKLKHGGYAVLGEKEIMEVPIKEYAEVFESIVEAEEFCNTHWIEASILPWAGQNVINDGRD